MIDIIPTFQYINVISELLSEFCEILYVKWTNNHYITYHIKCTVRQCRVKLGVKCHLNKKFELNII